MWLQDVINGGIGVAAGLQSRSAAKNAAQELDEGAQQAGETYQRSINDYAPMLLDAADQGGQAVMGAGEFAAGDVTAAGDRSIAGMDDANELLEMLFGANMEQLAPYREAGAAALQKAAGVADERFTFSEDDPSYRWRLEEGTKALERSAAARGTLAGGGTMKALTRYAQGAASQEYGAAFDRFQTDKAVRSKTLMDLVGLGERANALGISTSENYGRGVSANKAQAGSFDLTSRKQAGDYRVGTTQYASGLKNQAMGDFVGLQVSGGRYRADARKEQAEARAGGMVGAANAWNSIAGTATKANNDFWARRDGKK